MALEDVLAVRRNASAYALFVVEPQIEGLWGGSYPAELITASMTFQIFWIFLTSDGFKKWRAQEDFEPPTTPGS